MPLLEIGLLLLLLGFFLVIQRLLLVAVLPLDFYGRLRFVRIVCILGALHGIHAFLFFFSEQPIEAAVCCGHMVDKS